MWYRSTQSSVELGFGKVCLRTESHHIVLWEVLKITGLHAHQIVSLWTKAFKSAELDDLD
jgi:uncharacterized protein (UPF0548 family)